MTIFKKYVRKPVQIEAIQWVITKLPIDDAQLIIDEIKSTGGNAWFGSDPTTRDPAIFIETLEGTMRTVVGDYICRGLKGEYWPVKPDIFEKTNRPIAPGDFLLEGEV